MASAAEDGARSTTPAAVAASVRSENDLPPIPEAVPVDAKVPSNSHDPQANGAAVPEPNAKSNNSNASTPRLSAMSSSKRADEAEDYLNGGRPHGTTSAVDYDSGAASSTRGKAGAGTEVYSTPISTPGPRPVAEAGDADGNAETPPVTPGPAGRRSVQFSRSDVVFEPPGSSTQGHVRQTSWDTNNPSRSRAFMSRLKALAVQGGLPTPKGPGSENGGGVSSASSPTTTRSDSRHLNEDENENDDSDADADAEETADEAAVEDAAARTKKRRRRRPPHMTYLGGDSTAGGLETEPNSPLPSSSRLNMLLQRRATMPEPHEHRRGGLSEGEGRDHLNRQNGFRRGSSWLGRSDGNDDLDTPGRALGHVRRRTHFGGSGMGGISDGDGMAMTPRRTFFAGDRATTYGAQKWRQMKNTLKLLRQKREDRFDYYKSAELMAELRAGAPAVLMLASMIQRDEHGNKRIPVLLEQVKVHISDSTPMQDGGDSERHWLFTIDLEYGSGPSRMTWTVKRTIREILELHWKYKLALRNDKYLHTVQVGARPKQPRFPISAFPYVRGWRGVEIDDEDDGASIHDTVVDGEPGQAAASTAAASVAAGEGTAGEGTGTDAENGHANPRRRKPRMVLGMSRRSSLAAGVATGTDAGQTMAPDGQMQAVDEVAFRRKYVDSQQRLLEKYLQEMIHWLIFRADSNRLCRFLELSALGVRLAAEGSYHGKECFLHIQSSKGLDFRRVLTPGKVIQRHSRKWFLVRQSYIVCVESPENMNIYDVYLVDPKFLLISKKHKRKQIEEKVRKAKVRHEDLDLSGGEHLSKHHTLTILTSERRVKLWGRNQQLIGQFEDSIVDMLKQTAWHQRHRFDSFAPVRTGVFAQWLVDGRDYMWNVSRAISMAKDVVYIHDWWISPELYMRRPAAISQKWRLDRLLQRKASEGVKIFVIVYRNVEAAIPIDSEYTKFSLLNLHPNIFVQRSPNQFKKNQFFFAHHEKICVVDHDVAFIGGIDLCFGRWDSPQHSLVDDKPTGFELGAEEPKDADHCQLWPGKDYSNPRVQDFFNLREPYKEMYDRAKVPRMPWHDVGMQVVGQPARDLTRHFVQRWNYLRRGRKPTRPTPFLLPPPDFRKEDLESLGLDGTCEVQILRSASAWSLGVTDVECSIQTAYVSLIEESEHFVYMENQFFISSTETLNVRIVNRIGDALVERIIRAHRDDEDWRCVIIIPLMPGFQNSVADQEGTSVRLILQCQYRSICRGENSIFGRLRAEGIEPEDYIQFFSLRQWGRINNKTVLTTEQLYIHAKTIIVDDRVALIGSANINERSMVGDRDSEIAAVIRDSDMIMSTMACEPYRVGRFAHTLRLRLMQEHLGLDTDDILEDNREREEEFEDAMGHYYSDDGGAHMHGSQFGSGSDFDTDASPVAGSSVRAKARKRTNELGSRNRGMSPYDLQRAPSINHDVDLQGGYATDDSRSGRGPEPNEPENNAKDVAGGGNDQWTASKKQGADRFRDSVIVDGREVLVDGSFDQPQQHALKEVSTNGAQASVSNGTKDEANGSSAAKRSISTPDASKPNGAGDSGVASTTAVQDMAASSPPKQAESSEPKRASPQRPQQAASPGAHGDSDAAESPLPSNPLVPDIKLARITKDCMIDPVDPAFYDDVWARVAENNTKIFRRVFRCMPDSQVTNWHEFQEFIAYNKRFQESMEWRKKSDDEAENGHADAHGDGNAHGHNGGVKSNHSHQGHHRHAAGGGAGISVPSPGSVSAVAAVGETVTRIVTERHSHHNNGEGGGNGGVDRPGGTDNNAAVGSDEKAGSKVEMEKAAAADNALKHRPAGNPVSFQAYNPAPAPATASSTEKQPEQLSEQQQETFNEKTGLAVDSNNADNKNEKAAAGQDKRTTFLAPEKPGTGNGAGSGTVTASAPAPAPAAASSSAANVGSVKRRRRATTKSSRRGPGMDELLSQAEADDLMKLMQGQLVQFPYDWLSVEEGNGNWLYQVDQVAPLQIYN